MRQAMLLPLSPTLLRGPWAAMGLIFWHSYEYSYSKDYVRSRTRVPSRPWASPPLLVS